ncbi:hypothetical protein B0F90DRAFT_1667232 [Multifurca ochricompacta]|uniref:Uncharacterized protein n=1 Tax=Multifurca ochricompacta TaxID=376703 RepID=A0AAD4M5K1_9AGAM|nr:hypothetical protein B0F90DRAFT_1667232 [Multifurca ochricompacta]
MLCRVSLCILHKTEPRICVSPFSIVTTPYTLLQYGALGLSSNVGSPVSKGDGVKFRLCSILHLRTYGTPGGKSGHRRDGLSCVVGQWPQQCRRHIETPDGGFQKHKPTGLFYDHLPLLNFTRERWYSRVISLKPKSRSKTKGATEEYVTLKIDVSHLHGGSQIREEAPKRGWPALELLSSGQMGSKKGYMTAAE